MAKPTVLIVDDEPDLVELVTLTLERMHLATRRRRHSGRGARAARTQRRFDLCLTDMRLPDGDGLDLVAWIEQNQPQLPVAVITAHGNVETAVRALKAGAFDFVSKPLDLGVLRRLVAVAIRLGEADQTAITRAGPLLLGQLRGHGRAARADRARGAQPGPGAHLGRIGHGQGTGRAAHPRGRRAPQRAVHRRQLRRHSRPS